VKITIVQFLLFVTPERENEILSLTPCQPYKKSSYNLEGDSPEILTHWMLKHLRDMFRKASDCLYINHFVSPDPLCPTSNPVAVKDFWSVGKTLNSRIHREEP
jgi:hypothetical protein